MTSQDPEAPRVLALVKLAMEQLGLQALSPFRINSTLGVLAVVGGVLVAPLFGDLAGRLLLMQNLVIAAVGFVFVMMIMRRWALTHATPADGVSRLKTYARIIDVAVVVFLLASFLFGGVAGPLEFVALTWATFVGAWRGEPSPRTIVDVGVRCAAAMVVLQVVAGVCMGDIGIEKWPGAPGSVVAAVMFFATLAILERTPVYLLAANRALETVEQFRLLATMWRRP